MKWNDDILINGFHPCNWIAGKVKGWYKQLQFALTPEKADWKMVKMLPDATGFVAQNGQTVYYGPQWAELYKNGLVGH